MEIPGTRHLRDKNFTSKIIRIINHLTKEISKPLKIMHVCGTHEHTISKYGLRSLLPDNLEILSGPGCPVCVCPAADIDKAIELGKRENTIITTFGDMIRVPASNLSLADLKATGGDVRIVYGPHDAIKIARENPQKEVIFFAIGFETTVPTIGYEI
ncbi:MAG: hydrogenase formation protein HypD, partial [Candidatus Hermodarchaeota archaeon]